MSLTFVGLYALCCVAAAASVRSVLCGGGGRRRYAARQTPAPAPPLYLGVDCEQWGKECGGRENMDGLRHGGPSPLLSSFFNAAAAPPFSVGSRRRRVRESIKAVQTINFPPTEERLVAAAGSVKSSVSNKQGEIGISPPPSTSCRRTLVPSPRPHLQAKGVNCRGYEAWHFCSLNT